MLSFLMGDENLQVIEITLTWETLADALKEVGDKYTVITPRSCKEFLNVGMTALLLADHFVDEGESYVD
jgi:hypothetical protein